MKITFNNSLIYILVCILLTTGNLAVAGNDHNDDDRDQQQRTVCAKSANRMLHSNGTACVRCNYKTQFTNPLNVLMIHVFMRFFIGFIEQQ